jgi:hypothetical protein
MFNSSRHASPFTFSEHAHLALIWRAVYKRLTALNKSRVELIWVDRRNKLTHEFQRTCVPLFFMVDSVLSSRE